MKVRFYINLPSLIMVVVFFVWSMSCFAKKESCSQSNLQKIEKQEKTIIKKYYAVPAELLRQSTGIPKFLPLLTDTRSPSRDPFPLLSVLLTLNDQMDWTYIVTMITFQTVVRPNDN